MGVNAGGLSLPMALKISMGGERTSGTAGTDLAEFH